MNKITKKTAFGIVGASAATLLVGGFAAPAMAGTSDSHTPMDSISGTSSETTQTHLDLLDDIGLQGGDILGDISNESPVVLAPEVGVGDIGSGNAIGSGNDTAIGNNLGNGNDVGANVSDIVDTTTGVSSEVSDVVDSVTDVSDVVDSVDVDGMISDITDDLDLGGILGD
jgi:hypothetical protein